MPERFASIHEARRLFRVLFVWYNRGHRHSGIAILTPGMVSKARQPVLDAAFERHPERYVNEKPSVGKLPGSVWINLPVPLPEALIDRPNASGVLGAAGRSVVNY